MRTLQEEGFIGHKSYGPTYQYFAKVTKEEYKQRSLIGLIDKYFDNSYLSAVSALVKEVMTKKRICCVSARLFSRNMVRKHASS